MILVPRAFLMVLVQTRKWADNQRHESAPALTIPFVYAEIFCNITAMTMFGAIIISAGQECKELAMTG